MCGPGSGSVIWEYNCIWSRGPGRSSSSVNLCRQRAEQEEGMESRGGEEVGAQPDGETVSSMKRATLRTPEKGSPPTNQRLWENTSRRR